jgi:hypothetical protein
MLYWVQDAHVNCKMRRQLDLSKTCDTRQPIQDAKSPRLLGLINRRWRLIDVKSRDWGRGSVILGNSWAEESSYEGNWRHTTPCDNVISARHFYGRVLSGHNCKTESSSSFLFSCRNETKCWNSVVKWDSVSVYRHQQEVNLRPTVSRPVYPGVRRPSGTRDQFFFLFEISFRQLRVCYFVAPSLTRGRVCSLLVQLLLGLARAVTLVSKSRRTHDHILLSHLGFPQPGGPGPRIYIPQEQGGPVIPPGTGLGHQQRHRQGF